jgi:hypothetical protein
MLTVQKITCKANEHKIFMKPGNSLLFLTIYPQTSSLFQSAGDAGNY